MGIGDKVSDHVCKEIILQLQGLTSMMTSPGSSDIILGI